MAGLYGIADFANEFNKVRDDSLDSGFKAKNRMRADYLADYMIPGTLSTIDEQTYKAQQQALINREGFGDFVDKGLYGIKKDAEQAKDDYSTYLSTAIDNKQNAINKARRASLASGIDLHKVEADDYIARLRQQAIANGLTNELDIKRWIYDNADPDKVRANPQLADMLFQGRRTDELNNAKSSLGLGYVDPQSIKFLQSMNSPQISLAGANDLVITLPDGTVLKNPLNQIGSNNVIDALYGYNPTGLGTMQANVAKAHAQIAADQAKAGAWRQSRAGDKKDDNTSNMGSTSSTNSVVFGGSSNPPYGLGGTSSQPTQQSAPKPPSTQAAPSYYQPPPNLNSNEQSFLNIPQAPIVPKVSPTGDEEVDRNINVSNQKIADDIFEKKQQLAELQNRIDVANADIEEKRKKIASNEAVIQDLTSKLKIVIGDDQKFINNRINALMSENKKLNASISLKERELNKTGIGLAINRLQSSISRQEQQLSSNLKQYGVTEATLVGN